MKEVPLDDQEKKKEDDSEDESTASDDIFGDSSKKPETEKKDDKGEDNEDVIATRLIRFYDLDPKKVGETYFYRLRVWLKDPNDPDFYKAKIAKKKAGKGNQPSAGGGTSVGGEEDAGKTSKKGSGKKGGNMEPVEPPTPVSLQSLHSEVRDRLKMKRDKPTIPKDIADYEDDTEDVNKVKTALQFGIATEWVESQPVTIGEGFETFVTGPVDAPTVVRNPTGGWFTSDEPSVTVVANSFQADVGLLVPATKEDVLRGSLLNYEAVAHLLDPLTWEIRDMFESVDSRNQRKGRRFKTDAIVLDIMGGDRLLFKSKNRAPFFAPGEMLLMDRNGRIEIHNDIEDTTEFRHANFASEINQATRDAAKGRRGGDDDDEKSGGMN